MFFGKSGFSGAWERFNVVCIGFSSKLPHQLHHVVKYYFKSEPQTLEKMNFATSVKNQTFMVGVGETVWGKMSVMTVGSFQGFMKNVTETRVLQVKVNAFPKTSICIFSV